MPRNSDHILGNPTTSADRRLSADWERTREWIESETGMDLSGARFSRMRDAVVKLLGPTEFGNTRIGAGSPPERNAGFLERVTAHLTVGESFFFRNEHHFRVLREQVLPKILAENSARREVRIWSAGCATGEEPHSLAIVLDQLLSRQPGWRISILGTDLNPEFLERAREASYRQWSFRQTDIHLNRSYFVTKDETYRLIDRLREQVRWAYLNLVKDVYPSPLTGTVGLDLILFRNVAIYLKPEVTAAILKRFYQALRPGGWLLLGETEVTATNAGEFEVRRFEQATFYQKPTDSSSIAAQDETTSPPPALQGAWTGVRLPSVPELPEWAPLPQRATSCGAAAPKSSGMLAEGATWERIESALSVGNSEEAERRLNQVTATKQRAALRLRLVRALLTRAEISRAYRMLDLCLQEEPLLIEAQLLKAGFAEESGDLEGAERACRRALYVDPQALIAHFQLALVLERQGNAAGALRGLRTTLKLLEGQDAHGIVRFSDGVCHGRLKEMVLLFLSKTTSADANSPQ